MLGFGYIIIGLSLVSMVINIIQSSFQQSYTAALSEFENKLQFIDSDSVATEEGDVFPPAHSPYMKSHPDDPERNAVLGILQLRRTSNRRRDTDRSSTTSSLKIPLGSPRQLQVAVDGQRSPQRSPVTVTFSDGTKYTNSPNQV